jgi:hypothetical protein
MHLTDMNQTLSPQKPTQGAPGKRLPNRAIRTFLADDSPVMLALLARILRKDDRIMRRMVARPFVPLQHPISIWSCLICTCPDWTAPKPRAF